MPVLTTTDVHGRIWSALLRAADAISACPSWPKIPGCERWAYDAADRVATYVCSAPSFDGMPFEDRLAAALKVHRSLAWRTAHGRADRFGGRHVRLDDLTPSAEPGRADRCALFEVTDVAIAREFRACGLPPWRAAAAALRFGRGMAFDDIRAALVSVFGSAPSTAAIRTVVGRDAKRWGPEVARRLGLEPPAAISPRISGARASASALSTLDFRPATRDSVAFNDGDGDSDRNTACRRRRAAAR